MSSGVSPACQGEVWLTGFGGFIGWMKFAFCIFGRAVFAEPAITKIKKVIGLVHVVSVVRIAGTAVS